MDFYGILFDMKNGKKIPYSKNYFDTLFAENLAGVTTLTGTLPLTFTTSETALRSWTIYGNNTQHKYSAEGTLPLTFNTNTAGAASDWSIRGNDDVGKNKLEITATSGTYTNGGASLTYTIDKTAGTITLNGTSRNDGEYFVISLSNFAVYGDHIISGGSEFASYRIWDTTANAYAKKTDNSGVAESYGGDSTVRLPENHTFAHRIRVAPQKTFDNVVLQPMLRLPDTPANFEPYQVGVGQRTENLFELKRVSDYNGVTAQSIIAYGVAFTVSGDKVALSNQSTNTYPQIFLNSISGQDCPKLESGKTYSAKVFVENKPANSTIYIHVKVKNRNDTNWQSGYVAKIETSGTIFTVSQDWDIWGYLLIAQGNNVTYQDTNVRFCLTEGSTAPQNYIPYGYEIPLTVNNTPQTFYIGSTPLTAGQSISKTSTGIDIAAIAGTNTITTELYNKPEMAIEGVDYVGVGEYVNDSWQIPLTVTHYTDNIFDKDAKNTNKGYEDSTCIMWAGSIPYPYMTGNEDNNYFVSEKIPASPNTTYYLTDGIFKNSDNGIYSVLLWNRFRMSDYQAFPTEKTFTTGDDTKFIQLCVLKSYADTVMITTKPTETYIPHVEVNDVNVPIDAPLTEGQSVTDTQTINTFEGENTIDTTMTNKPNMSITYKGG